MEITISQQKKAEPQTPNQAPAAAPAAEPQLIIPTPDEIRQRLTDTYSSMGWGKPPEEKVPTPAAAGPTASPDSAPSPALAPDQPAAATPPAAGAPAPEEPVVQEEPTTAEIITRAARETAREVAQALRPETPAAPKAPAFEMTPEDSRDLRVLRYMENAEPDQYAGIAQKFTDYVKKNYEYQAKWAAENPDKEFDADADEHAAFYRANMPDVDQDALERFRIDMIAEEKVQKILGPKQEEERRNQVFNQAVPVIGSRVAKSVLAMVEEVNPELAKLVKDASGNPVLNPDTVGKVDEADPIAKEVMDDIVSNRLQPMVHEIEMTQVAGLNHRLDASKNPIHAEIVRFVNEKERELLKGPASVREVNGRQFCTLTQYADRTTKILRLPEDQQDAAMQALDNEVWCLNADQIEELLVHDCAERAKKIIQKRDGQAQKKYGTSRPAGNTPPPKPTVQPIPGPMPAGMKYKAPAGGGQAEVVTTNTPGRNTPKSFGEEAVAVNFSR